MATFGASFASRPLQHDRRIVARWRSRHRPADTTGRCIRLAFVLPEQAAMARPTGVGRAITAYDMPIEGRDEWLAAAARHFA